MNQFLEAALQPINMPYTGMMVVVLVYWLTVILGVLDFSFLDFAIFSPVNLSITINEVFSFERASYLFVIHVI